MIASSIDAINAEMIPCFLRFLSARFALFRVIPHRFRCRRSRRHFLDPPFR